MLAKPMRILHYSDPHIPTPLHHVPLFKWLSKRAVGGANLFLGRRRLFSDAAVKLAALARFKEEQQVDLVICTGDYTALGLNHEYEEAVKATQPLMDAPSGYVNVPGNHDYYVTDAIREERFSKYFGDTLDSDLPEYQVDGPWPLVKLIGDDFAIIAVNSARPNPLPWRSNGRIPAKQLEALVSLSKDSRLADRLVFIMTHYAPLLSDGRHDSRLHGLINTEPFLAACAEFRQALILCGHVHQCYHVTVHETAQAIFCAGSATMNKKEGFWLFDLYRKEVKATPGRWDGQQFVLNMDSIIALFNNRSEQC